MMIYQTMRDGPITAHRLEGGIAVYLLIGMFCAKLYHLIALNVPHAFVGVEDTTPLPPFVYFSFVTLTTLGYGDILPVSHLARSMAMGEGLVGQLFPAIFIARLVTLQTDTRKH